MQGGCDMRAATMAIETLRSAPNLVITRTDAAAALGVDPRTVTAGIENGTIPSVKLGRRALIPREKSLQALRPRRLPRAWLRDSLACSTERSSNVVRTTQRGGWGGPVRG